RAGARSAVFRGTVSRTWRGNSKTQNPNTKKEKARTLGSFLKFVLWVLGFPQIWGAWLVQVGEPEPTVVHAVKGEAGYAPSVHRGSRAGSSHRGRMADIRDGSGRWVPDAGPRRWITHPNRPIRTAGVLHHRRIRHAHADASAGEPEDRRPWVLRRDGGD